MELPYDQLNKLMDMKKEMERNDPSFAIQLLQILKTILCPMNQEAGQHQTPQQPPK